MRRNLRGWTIFALLVLAAWQVSSPANAQDATRSSRESVESTFAFKPSAFGKIYNAMADQLAVDQERVSLVKCEATSVEYVCQYELSTSGALVTSRTIDSNARFIWFTLGGPEAGAAMTALTSIVVTIAALNPEFTPEQRGQVFRPFVKDGGKPKGEAWVGNTHYTVEAVTGMGVWLMVAADVRKREMTPAQTAALYQKMSDGKWTEIMADPTLTEDELFQHLAELTQTILSYTIHCRKPLTSASEGVAVMAWTFLDHSHKAEEFKKDAKEVVENRIASTGPKNWCAEFAPIVDRPR